MQRMLGCLKRFIFENCKIYYNLNGMIDNHWQVIDVVVAMEMVSIDPYLAVIQYQVIFDENIDQTIDVLTHAL